MRVLDSTVVFVGKMNKAGLIIRSVLSLNFANHKEPSLAACLYLLHVDYMYMYSTALNMATLGRVSRPQGTCNN